MVNVYTLLLSSPAWRENSDTTLAAAFSRIMNKNITVTFVKRQREALGLLRSQYDVTLIRYPHMRGLYELIHESLQLSDIEIAAEHFARTGYPVTPKKIRAWRKKWAIIKST